MRGELARVLEGIRSPSISPRDMPPLDVDPVLIGQALANVLENAAKYSPPGSRISVTAEVRDGKATVAVTDQGPGVPIEERAAVFDLFHRIARGDGAPAGTGMGLAIVKGSSRRMAARSPCSPAPAVSAPPWR